MKKLLYGLIFALVLAPFGALGAQSMAPQTLRFGNGTRLTLQAPRDVRISLAAQGFRRVRFMAVAPDGRVFVSDLHDKSDNRRGAIWILDGFDARTGVFARKSVYLAGLRNPNSLAFFTEKSGVSWLYVAQTHALVRYAFRNGDLKPRGTAQVLATYPDYGLSYKCGGWHLTRTLAFDSAGRAYVSVGSSCNACLEKEPIRATISRLDADGKNQTIIATGLRNAVGLKWVGDQLFATNMGADHLGVEAPNDTLVRIEENADFGWPSVYVRDGKNYRDPLFANQPTRREPAKTPRPFAWFPAHSSPLGLEFFDAKSSFPALRDGFLVALHGSGFPAQKRGYKVVFVPRNAPQNQRDFLTGFQIEARVQGRPCDILRFQNGLLISDDYRGALYFVAPRNWPAVL